MLKYASKCALLKQQMHPPMDIATAIDDRTILERAYLFQFEKTMEKDFKKAIADAVNKACNESPEDCFRSSVIPTTATKPEVTDSAEVTEPTGGEVTDDEGVSESVEVTKATDGEVTDDKGVSESTEVTEPTDTETDSSEKSPDAEKAVMSGGSQLPWMRAYVRIRRDAEEDQEPTSATTSEQPPAETSPAVTTVPLQLTTLIPYVT